MESTGSKKQYPINVSLITPPYTRLYDFFKNAHNINDVAKIQPKNCRNTDEIRYPFAQLVDPMVKPRGFEAFFIKSSYIENSLQCTSQQAKRLISPKYQYILQNPFGEMAERLKAHAWKVCIRQKRIEGSNPSLSATLTTSYYKHRFKYAYKLI